MPKIPIPPPQLPPIPSKEDIENIDWERLKENPANKNTKNTLPMKSIGKPIKNSRRKNNSVPNGGEQMLSAS